MTEEQVFKDIRDMITRIEYEGGGVNGGDRCAKKIVKYIESALKSQQERLVGEIEKAYREDRVIPTRLAYFDGIQRAIEIIKKTYG